MSRLLTDEIPWGIRSSFIAVPFWMYYYSDELASEDRPAEIWTPEKEYYSDVHQRPHNPIRD